MYLKRILYIGCVLSVFVSHNALGQFYKSGVDSSYIHNIESKWVLGGQFGSFQNSLRFSDPTQELTFELTSNVQPTVGIFVKYKKLPGLKVSIPVSSDNDSTQITSKGLNIGIHLNPIQGIIGDIYYSRLKRYNYSDIRNDLTFVVPVADVKTSNFAINGYYVLNHKKFSYKHAFAVGQRQIKKQGSWLFGLSFNSTSQEKESILFEGQELLFQKSDFQSIEALQVAILAGYAYNWIFGKKKNGFISAGAFFGPNFHQGDIRYLSLEDDSFSGSNLSAKVLLSGGLKMNSGLQILFKFFFNDYGYSLPTIDLRNELFDGELSIVKYLH